MAYKDNYPNGYKSGYSSADDPERKDYSDLGVEAQRRDALADSYERERRMSEYEAGLEKERQREQKIQQQYEKEEMEKQRLRKNAQETSEKYVDSIKHLAEQMRKKYQQKSFFTRAMLTLRGKGYHNIKFWDNAKAEIDKMSDEELNDYYKRNVR